MSPLAREAKPLLSTRWTPLYFHAPSSAYSRSPHRFNVVPAGRRSGKTERAKRKLVWRALTADTEWPDPRFFAGAPVRDQAKRIFWEDLKALVPKRLIYNISESELHIDLLTGAQLWVVGLDRPERVEGFPWDGGILDEFANMRKDAWGKNIRPALMDRGGFCDFIGVPEGRNHYYDLYMDAKTQMEERGDKSEWGAFSWRSEEVLPLYGRADEIVAAKHDLDELTYEQELGGAFVSFSGAVYYNFNAQRNCAHLEYNPNRPLIFCYDFNVNPGVAVVCQEIEWAPGLEVTGVIGEVWIERGSNTSLVTFDLCQDWHFHRGPIYVFGDASGGNTHSSQTEGNDWEIVRRGLYHKFPGMYHLRVPANNPSIRGRINAMNSRCKSIDGTVRLLVDPVKAPHTVKDLEGTPVTDEGLIDKDKDGMLSHLCFAGHTTVETPQGILRMDELPAEGKVRGWHGDWVDYVAAGLTQKNVEVVVVRFGGQEAICTPMHQWLTEVGWQCAKDLKGHRLKSWQTCFASPLARQAGHPLRRPPVWPAKPADANGVIEVQPAGRADVYCLKVPTDGCFALADGGWIVSNSDALGYYVAYRFPVRGQKVDTKELGW